MAQPILSSTIICYVDAKRLGLFGGGNQVNWVDLPASAIKDYDVISKLELNKTITGLLTAAKLTNGLVILVFLASTIFEKDFPTLNPEEREVETQRFFDSVPFERVLARVYPLPVGWKAVAVNRDVYEAVRDGFISEGFQTLAVVPEFILASVGVKGQDAGASAQVLKKLELLKPQTMMVAKLPEQSLEQKEEELAKSHTPLILLIFFVFMALVIGGTVIFLHSEAPKPKVVTVPPTTMPTFTPSPAIEAPVTATGSSQL